MEAGRACQEAIEVTQVLGDGDLTMQCEWSIQVGSSGGFDVRAHLGGWCYYEDKGS